MYILVPWASTVFKWGPINGNNWNFHWFWDYWPRLNINPLKFPPAVFEEFLDGFHILTRKSILTWCYSFSAISCWKTRSIYEALKDRCCGNRGEGVTPPSLLCFAAGDKLEGLCSSSLHILVKQVYFSSQHFLFLTHRHRSTDQECLQIKICNYLQNRLSPLLPKRLFLGKVYFPDGFPQGQFFVKDHLTSSVNVI